MRLRNDRVARVLAIANFPLGPFIVDDNGSQTKNRFGATPKPARETHAPPEFANTRWGLLP